MSQSSETDSEERNREEIKKKSFSAMRSNDVKKKSTSKVKFDLRKKQFSQKKNKQMQDENLNLRTIDR